MFVLSQVVQIVLWYLDSGCSRHMTGDRARLINFVEKFIGTVRFGNDEYAAIIGYGNYKPHQTKRFKRQPKRVWKPISKPVANSKPQWKPTGRHLSLFEKYPLTRIMESTDMPIELPTSASSSPQITMVSRFTDHKLSDRKAGSTDCSMVSGFCTPSH
ncbi:hypothetical protein Tco_1478817 [Tanacetum coccineum]